MKRVNLLIVATVSTLLILPFIGKAQFFTDDSSRNASLVDVNMSINFPVFGMAKRFGYFQQPAIEYKEKFRSNIMIGASFGYQFGSRLRFDPLSSLRDKDSTIFNTNGLPGDVQLTYRGFNGLITIGKLWAFNHHHQNRGLYTELGMGYWWYHVRINTANNDIVQLAGDYKYGYDRLTSGFPLHEFIGYFHMGERGLANYFFGFDLCQGFNTLQHNYDYNSGMYMPSKVFDMTVGFKAGFVLPLYHEVSKTVYVN